MVRGSGNIAVVLPPGAPREGMYSASMIEDVKAAITSAMPRSIDVIDWPLTFNPATLARVELADCAVVDVGPASAATGLPAYLHGRFVPTIRLKHAPASKGRQRDVAARVDAV